MVLDQIFGAVILNFPSILILADFVDGQMFFANGTLTASKYLL